MSCPQNSNQVGDRCYFCEDGYTYKRYTFWGNHKCTANGKPTIAAKYCPVNIDIENKQCYSKCPPNFSTYDKDKTKCVSNDFVEKTENLPINAKCPQNSKEINGKCFQNCDVFNNGDLKYFDDFYESNFPQTKYNKIYLDLSCAEFSPTSETRCNKTDMEKKNGGNYNILKSSLPDISSGKCKLSFNNKNDLDNFKLCNKDTVNYNDLTCLADSWSQFKSCPTTKNTVFPNINIPTEKDFMCNNNNNKDKKILEKECETGYMLISNQCYKRCDHPTDPQLTTLNQKENKCLTKSLINRIISNPK
jgi:hypothetical protein